MKEVINQIHMLQELSGNSQVDYLRQVANPLLEEVLEYTLNKNKMYKITEKKYSRASMPLFNTNDLSNNKDKELTLEVWHKFTQELNYLASVPSATDADVQRVYNIIECCNEKAFLKGVLFKDLRLGMDVTTVQKVYPNFCVGFPYMGCKSFSLGALKKIPYPAYAQTKMDGSFCNVVVDTVNKTVEYISRQSKPQPLRGCFLDNFCDYWLGDSHFTEKFVLTGEALVWDAEKDKPLPRKLANGILRRKDKTQDELDRIHFTCWDFIPYENFIAKRWNVPYKDRYLWLKTRLDDFMGLGKFHVVNTWVVNSVDEAMAKFDEQYALGEEGIVVKAMKQPWVNGKPSGQVKVKAEKECELRMLGFEEGKGAYAGKCGNILCESEDGGIAVGVKPRTMADAEYIWAHQEECYRGILTVKFNEVIQSQSREGVLSLYLPVFQEIRDDKAVADTTEYIKALK